MSCQPKRKPLNLLPENPELTSNALGRFPSWLHRSLPPGGALAATGRSISSTHLHTVCQEARCPNRLECWSRGTATFLALGKSCTRACGFCSIATSPTPPPPDPEEPLHIAQAVQQLALRHAVITMVARDDLPDGGASHVVRIVEQIRSLSPHTTIELLTSDFEGSELSLQQIANAAPTIFNHNVETVERLTPRVRHKATYQRSLALLKKYRELASSAIVKSGLMVGLGETEEEVQQTLYNLAEVGCTIVTIGQYLQPERKKLLVKEFVPPEQFEKYAAYGRSKGIPHMYCGPFIRSSYNADSLLDEVLKQATPMV